MNQTKQPLKFYTNYTPNNVSSFTYNRNAEMILKSLIFIPSNEPNLLSKFSQIDQTIQNSTKVIWAQKLLFFSYVFSTTK